MILSPQIIQKIIQLAEVKFPNAEIYVYGSQARGEAHPDSDWDLLILLEMPTISFEQETQLMDDFYELELQTGEVFSPLIYSKSNWYQTYTQTPIFQNIREEGIKIK